MWHQMDQFDSDEIVADGAAFRQKASPFVHQRVGGQHFVTSVEKAAYPPYTHSQEVYPMTNNTGSSTHTKPYIQVKSSSDSGFHSGVNTCEDLASGGDSASELSSHYANMKISNSSSFHDSGLDVGYFPSQGQKISNTFTSQTRQPGLNNLSSSKHSECNPHTKPITLEDLLKQDEDGDTPLHLAVLQGFIEVVFSLVRILPEPCLLEIPNHRLQTPLHLAVLTNQAPLVRRLVVGGASVHSRDRNGNTPLHLACRDGHIDCVKALCMPISLEERQAALLHHDIPPQPLPQDLEQRNYDGQMPLHLAVIGGHLQVVKLLCCFGANVNAIEGKNGRTPLHYAVERRWPAVLHFLIAHGGAKIEAETYNGYSAYQLASVIDPVLTMLLVKLGATVRPMPMESRTPSGSEDSDSESEIAVWRHTKDQGLAVLQRFHLTA